MLKLCRHEVDRVTATVKSMKNVQQLHQLPAIRCEHPVSVREETLKYNHGFIVAIDWM